MRGEFIGVWAETWREIWLPFIEQPLAEDDEGPSRPRQFGIRSSHRTL